MLVSYPAPPGEPHYNGSSLLGPKAALQGPPSTLVLRSPHSQDLISHTAIRYFLNLLHPPAIASLSSLLKCQILLLSEHRQLTFSQRHTAFRHPFPDALIGNADHAITKGVLGSYLYHHDLSLKVVLQQHWNQHSNYLGVLGCFCKVSYRRKRMWTVAQSSAAHATVGQAYFWQYEAYVEQNQSIPKEIWACGTKLC